MACSRLGKMRTMSTWGSGEPERSAVCPQLGSGMLAAIGVTTAYCRGSSGDGGIPNQCSALCSECAGGLLSWRGNCFGRRC